MQIRTHKYDVSTTYFYEIWRKCLKRQHLTAIKTFKRIILLTYFSLSTVNCPSLRLCAFRNEFGLREDVRSNRRARLRTRPELVLWGPAQVSSSAVSATLRLIYINVTSSRLKWMFCNFYHCSRDNRLWKSQSHAVDLLGQRSYTRIAILRQCISSPCPLFSHKIDTFSMLEYERSKSMCITCFQLMLS